MILPVICTLYNVSTETLIAHFMEDFRSSFPDSSIPVKMHMLEEHTVPWARKTHVGFGLLGEQGAESIHARFNGLQRTYHSVPDKVQQLVLMVKEHLLSVAPQNVRPVGWGGSVGSVEPPRPSKLVPLALVPPAQLGPACRSWFRFFPLTMNYSLPMN